MTIPTLLLQALLAFCVTIGFGMLFNIPRETLLPCGLIGVLGHLTRISLRSLGMNDEVNTFSGALVVGLVGYWQAKRTGQPRLVFTVTGIISMIPGIPAYETVIFFSRNELLSGLQSMVRASLVTASIAVGLSTARLLTEIELTL